MEKRRNERHVLLGICGASGLIYARRALEVLRAVPDLKVHLVASAAADAVARAECLPGHWEEMRALAHVRYTPDDLGAPVASGSFPLSGMVLAPCSLHTAMALAAGLGDDLLLRAGQVCLKERRPLILLLRETPLATHHLRHLATLSEAGAVIMPASVGYYMKPQNIDDLIDPLVLRALSFLRIEGLPAAPAWEP